MLGFSRFQWPLWIRRSWFTYRGLRLGPKARLWPTPKVAFGSSSGGPKPGNDSGPAGLLLSGWYVTFCSTWQEDSQLLNHAVSGLRFAPTLLGVKWVYRPKDPARQHPLQAVRAASLGRR